MRSFVKINALQNVEITLSITDIGKSCLRCEFLTSQICLLTLFTKIEFLPKFPDLEYFYENILFFIFSVSKSE